MSTTATCVYTVNAKGQTKAALRTAIAAPPVDPFTLEVTGCTVASDTNAETADGASRTIVLTLTPAFKASFPNGTDQSVPFWEFMQGILEAAMNTPVLSAAPVIA
jgi:hypothetical protein